MGHGDQIVLEQGFLSLASKVPKVAHLLPQTNSHLEFHDVEESLPSRRKKVVMATTTTTTSSSKPSLLNKTSSLKHNKLDGKKRHIDEFSQFSWKLDLVQLPSTAPLERLRVEEAKQGTRVFTGTEKNIRDLAIASEMVRGLKITEFSPSLHPAYARRQVKNILFLIIYPSLSMCTHHTHK